MKYNTLLLFVVVVVVHACVVTIVVAIAVVGVTPLSTNKTGNEGVGKSDQMGL
jgi:hypothetical protein